MAKENYSVDSISFSPMRNSYHVAFHGNVARELATNDLTSVIGTALDMEYSNAIKAEQDIVNRSKASEYTAVLQEKDTIRDNYYRRVIYSLKAALLDSQNTAITDAIIAEINSKILNVYALDVTKKANQEETAIIKGFLQDIRALPADDLTVLNLDADLLKLESANNDYETNFMNRIHEYTTAVDTDAYRAATDSAYQRICIKLEYEANLEASDTTDETVKANIALAQTIITDINMLIKVFNSKTDSSSSDDTEDETETDTTTETTETKTDTAAKTTEAKTEEAAKADATEVKTETVVTTEDKAEA